MADLQSVMKEMYNLDVRFQHRRCSVPNSGRKAGIYKVFIYYAGRSHRESALLPGVRYAFNRGDPGVIPE